MHPTSLYHYKKKRGTTTQQDTSRHLHCIIPLQEKTGNYNATSSIVNPAAYYTTTRKNGELQQIIDIIERQADYTTTRKNGELQLGHEACTFCHNYTTTRKNGELQQVLWKWFTISKLYHYKKKRGTTTPTVFSTGMFLIIPLQEKTGNYNGRISLWSDIVIIPLQEKTGNYNITAASTLIAYIIPLQEKTGNYNNLALIKQTLEIIPLQEKTGNYNLCVDGKGTTINYTTTRKNGELQPHWRPPLNLSSLYHYKKKRGTTTKQRGF